MSLSKIKESALYPSEHNLKSQHNKGMHKLRSSQHGYGRIEIIIVAVMTGVLTSFVLPMYQDYQVRSQVRSVMTEAMVVTDAISDHYISFAMLPSSNKSAGLKVNTDYESDLVKSITVGKGGAITISLNNIKAKEFTSSAQTEGYQIAANDTFDGSSADAQITLRPQSSIMGQLVWTCASTTLDEKHTPTNCNSGPAEIPNLYPQMAWQF